MRLLRARVAGTMFTLMALVAMSLVGASSALALSPPPPDRPGYCPSFSVGGYALSIAYSDCVYSTDPRPTTVRDFVNLGGIDAPSPVSEGLLRFRGWGKLSCGVACTGTVEVWRRTATSNGSAWVGSRLPTGTWVWVAPFDASYRWAWIPAQGAWFAVASNVVAGYCVLPSSSYSNCTGTWKYMLMS